MRAAAKLVAHGSPCRSCVAWHLPPPPHRPVRLAHAGASRELLGVHPSSLIGENASIAPGARIGPFCVVSDDAVIGPNCELGAGVHILGATTLGADCVVRSHAVVGSPEPGTTVLGRGNVVGAHAVVGAVCADKKHAPALASHLVIGDGNDIREHAQIHRSSGPDTVTKIGSGCLLMGGVHVGHDCAVGDGVVVSNNALLAGHVVVGDHAVLGGAVAISQRNGVGAHAFVAGGARVDGWVPACARAAGDRAVIRGVNVVGLRRAGYARREILETIRAASALWRPAEETVSPPAEGGSPAFGTEAGGVHARLRPPDARELARRVEAALTDAERAAKKSNKATAKRSARIAPSPAERMLRDARETLSEPGRTLVPWRAITRDESARARALERAALLMESAGVDGRRGAETDAGVSPPTESDAADSVTTSPAPPLPPRLERTSPESLPEPEKLKRLNMASLKALLQVRGLPTDGMKYLLVARLDQNRDAPLNAESNAAAMAAEAADVAWRVRDPSRAPDCLCGDPCKEKTVRKEGPNKGKTFWACRRPKQAAPCGFFQWRSGTKKAASAPRRATRATVTPSAPTAAPTVDVRGGNDMFEDLVIMTSSRPRARDAATA